MTKKVVIINKSDSTGGAAVVSRRLMEALRDIGLDARMLVCEKLTDSPFVELAASPKKIKRKFLEERLKIFVANGFNLQTLFKIDTGEVGLPLWKHSLVKDADAILINWVNQGMLSLHGVEKILEMGKPVIWTMHDMWCMTGICHHAGTCRHYENECGECPLLGKRKGPNDLSGRIWKRKKALLSNAGIMTKMAFVPVSNWLKEKALQSSLLKEMCLEVIPNAFPVSTEKGAGKTETGRIRILFGAARLDDPIKGIDTLRETSKVIRDRYPEIAKKVEIAMFGSIKDERCLEGFGVPVVRLGILRGEEAVKKAYKESDILVSASSYETLPGTLVEAQAYGCIPVSFNQGGQRDIVSHLNTGYIAEYTEDIKTRAENLAEGLIWAITQSEDTNKLTELILRMLSNVEAKFSYEAIAKKYINLIKQLEKS